MKDSKAPEWHDRKTFPLSHGKLYVQIPMMIPHLTASRNQEHKMCYLGGKGWHHSHPTVNHRNTSQQEGYLESMDLHQGQ